MEILGFSKLRQEKNATDARKVFLYMKEDVTRVVSDVKELDTYQVRVFNEDKSDEDREEYTFEIPFQKGSIKVNGRNGVMIEELLEIVAMRITDLNGKFQCKENEEAIFYSFPQFPQCLLLFFKSLSSEVLPLNKLLFDR